MRKIIQKVKHYKWIVVLVIATIVIIIAGQKLLGSNSQQNNTASSVSNTVKKGNLTASVSASGQIQTANYLGVTTSVNGVVKKVYVTEGQKVTKGQNIMEVTLDQEGERSLADAYASYLRAKNSLDSAKSNLYNAETTMLQKEDAFKTEKERNSYQSHDERLSYKYAENDYLKAKSDYENQKASIQQLEIALDSAQNEYEAQSPTIKAPASGIVANIVAVEGTKIENSVTSDRSVKTVAAIKQEGTPIASVDVSEVDINSIKVGQIVNMTLSSIENKNFVGTVTGIDKVGSSTSGVSSYPVIIKFNEDSDMVLPNMSVDAEIILSQKENVLYVPTSAITTQNGKKYITTDKGQVEITTGLVAGTNTEIISGAQEGDAVYIETLPTSGYTTSNSTNTQRGGIGIMGIGGATRR